MTGPRDWDKEMAEIDKLIATNKTPGPPAPPAAAGRGSSVPATRSAGTGTGTITTGRHKFGVWIRAVIGIGGAVSLQLWPYGKSCGTMLYLYMAATVAVTLFGAWTMRGAWTHRRGFAHVGGLLVFLAGLSFAAIQILERTGYAAAPLGWTCP